jgi:hypothetical protein
MPSVRISIPENGCPVKQRVSTPPWRPTRGCPRWLDVRRDRGSARGRVRASHVDLETLFSPRNQCVQRSGSLGMRSSASLSTGSVLEHGQVLACARTLMSTTS